MNWCGADGKWEDYWLHVDASRGYLAAGLGLQADLADPLVTLRLTSSSDIEKLHELKYFRVTNLGGGKSVFMGPQFIGAEEEVKGYRVFGGYGGPSGGGEEEARMNTTATVLVAVLGGFCVVFAATLYLRTRKKDQSMKKELVVVMRDAMDWNAINPMRVSGSVVTKNKYEEEEQDGHNTMTENRDSTTVDDDDDSSSSSVV